MIKSNKLDGQLRDALEPDETTVDRLVANALAGHQKRPARRWLEAVRHRQLPTAAVAVALLAAVALPTLIFWPPGVPRDAPRRGEAPALTEASNPTPSSLRISNEDGPVIVTTPAGSKMVFLPLVFNNSLRGDAS